MKLTNVRVPELVPMTLIFTSRFGVAVHSEQTCRPAMMCSQCGGELRLLLVVDGSGKVLVDHRQRFLDSG